MMFSAKGPEFAPLHPEPVKFVLHPSATGLPPQYKVDLVFSCAAASLVQPARSARLISRSALPNLPQRSLTSRSLYGSFSAALMGHAEERWNRSPSLGPTMSGRC